MAVNQSYLAENNLDIQVDDAPESTDCKNEDMQITVRKIEFPVKPRGVLAE